MSRSFPFQWRPSRRWTTRATTRSPTWTEAHRTRASTASTRKTSKPLRHLWKDVDHICLQARRTFPSAGLISVTYHSAGDRHDDPVTEGPLETLCHGMIGSAKHGTAVAFALRSRSADHWIIWWYILLTWQTAWQHWQVGNRMQSRKAHFMENYISLYLMYNLCVLGIHLHITKCLQRIQALDLTEYNDITQFG